MRGEYGPIYRYSLFVSHYSLHSREWKRCINDANNILNFSAFKHLKTVNLQHIPVTIIKGIHVFHCSVVWWYNSRPVAPIKIILLS